LQTKTSCFFAAVAFKSSLALTIWPIWPKTIRQVLAVSNKLLDYSKSSVESGKFSNHYQGTPEAVTGLI
jgi:hypothetical protein